MRIELSRQWSEFLINQPEHGMGYHRCDIEFDNGRTLDNVLVFNCTEAAVPVDFAMVPIKNITLVPT